MNAEQKAEALRLAKWIERALYGEASLDEPADKAAALLRTLASEPQDDQVSQAWEQECIEAIRWYAKHKAHGITPPRSEPPEPADPAA
jgi:hypothetical protein